MRRQSWYASLYVTVLAFLIVFLVVSCQVTKKTANKTSASTPTEITLAWDAPSVSDIAGYKVHYTTNSTGPPYDGTGLVEGNSPIVIPIPEVKDLNNPEKKIHGLSKEKTYFFVVTVYNEKGKESGFSEGILVKPTIGASIE